MIDACIGSAHLDPAGVPGRSQPCGFTAHYSYSYGGRATRCPKCGGDIEQRPRTREEALAAIAACLKNPCSECPDEGHHWLIDHLDEDDDEEREDFRNEHPQAVDEHGEPCVLDSRGEHDAEFAMGYVACKHCPAVKAWEGEDH